MKIDFNIGISEILSFIALIVSIGGSFYIPWKTKHNKNKRLEEELNNFKNILKNDYVGHLFIEIDKVVNGRTDRTRAQVQEMVRQDSYRLGKLKENELIYVTSDNQFKLIRMAEFAKTYLDKSQEVMKFTPASYISNEENTDMVKVREMRLNGLLKLRQLYESKLEKYANLEVDSLIDREEYEKMRNQIKYLEPNKKD